VTNVWDVVVWLVGCGTLVYCCSRMEGLLRWGWTTWVTQRPAPVSQPTAPQPEVSAPDPMPAALLQVALSENEPWAKEAVLKSMYEMYETTRNWIQVATMWAAQSFRDNT